MYSINELEQWKKDALIFWIKDTAKKIYEETGDIIIEIPEETKERTDYEWLMYQYQKT